MEFDDYLKQVQKNFNLVNNQISDKKVYKVIENQYRPLTKNMRDTFSKNERIQAMLQPTIDTLTDLIVQNEKHLNLSKSIQQSYSQMIISLSDSLSEIESQIDIEHNDIPIEVLVSEAAETISDTSKSEEQQKEWSTRMRVLSDSFDNSFKVTEGKIETTFQEPKKVENRKNHDCSKEDNSQDNPIKQYFQSFFNSFKDPEWLGEQTASFLFEKLTGFIRDILFLAATGKVNIVFAYVVIRAILSVFAPKKP